MSSGLPQPDFLVDRNLGRRFVDALRGEGWSIHTIADLYPNDAQEVPDEVWIADAGDRGWALLTKDQRIRYRAQELGALEGHMFCLAAGQLRITETIDRFTAARARIWRAAASDSLGFWKVYDGGRIERTWP